MYGFDQNTDEPCVYKRIQNDKVIFLVLYVDDILIIVNELGALSSTKWDYLDPIGLLLGLTFVISFRVFLINTYLNKPKLALYSRFYIYGEILHDHKFF